MPYSTATLRSVSASRGNRTSQWLISLMSRIQSWWCSMVSTDSASTFVLRFANSSFS